MPLIELESAEPEANQASGSQGFPQAESAELRSGCKRELDKQKRPTLTQFILIALVVTQVPTFWNQVTS